MLELGGNPMLGDIGAHALVAGICQGSLRTLGLDGIGLTDAAGTAIAEALRGRSSLTFLKLQHNSLTDKTAAELATCIREAVERGKPTLQRLLLQRNRIGDKGATALEAAITGSGVIELDLRSNLVTRPRLLPRIEAICLANSLANGLADGLSNGQADGQADGQGSSATQPTAAVSARGRTTGAIAGRTNATAGAQKATSLDVSAARASVRAADEMSEEDSPPLDRDVSRRSGSALLEGPPSSISQVCSSLTRLDLARSAGRQQLQLAREREQKLKAELAKRDGFAAVGEQRSFAFRQALRVAQLQRPALHLPSSAAPTSLIWAKTE